MDRKSIIVLVFCFLVLMAWQPLVNKFYPPVPITNAVPAQVTFTNGTAAVLSTQTSAVLPEAASTPMVASVPSIIDDTNAPEKLLEFTNRVAHYTFTSHGGGLKEVELLGFRETIPQRRGKQTGGTNFVTLESYKAPTLALLGAPELGSSTGFELARTARGVRAEKILTNGLAVIKEFQVQSNYVVSATVRIENRSGAAVKISPFETVVGTAGPIGPRDDPTTIAVKLYNGDSMEDIGEGWFANRKFGCLGSNPRSEFLGGSNIVWVSAQNQFFTMAMMFPKPVQNLSVKRLELPRFTGEAAKMVATNSAAPHGYFTTLTQPGVTIEPGKPVEWVYDIYAGPKEYQTLVQVASQFTNQVDKVMGFSFIPFIAKSFLLTMNWMHDSLSFPYGLAIIAITVIIKLVFWPLTQASTRSMKRLQALQPQLNEIREKYKDDPMKMNRKSMEFMREHKVSPLGGCLPMLLQIPVFFGFYDMIRFAIELRGAKFLWVVDLSSPDTLAVIPGLGFIPFFGIQGVGLPVNLLPLIMGVTMLWQARLTPPSPGMDPTQQKIMRYMPLMFMVFLYNFSAGLTLYWTVQNLLTIAQTKLTKMQDPKAAVTPMPVKPAVLTPKPKKRK